MTLIAVSQRVDIHPERGERRDALDQRWPFFLAACGLDAAPIPNNPAQIYRLIDSLPVSGVLLTGGNDIGECSERDETEAALIEWAQAHDRPLLGVCRGMQMILQCDDANLERVDGHAGTEHVILFDRAPSPSLLPVGERIAQGRRAERAYPKLGEGDSSGRENLTVNSFHNFGFRAAPDEYEILAAAPDGVIEMVRHRSRLVVAIMWHPERNNPFVAADIDLFRNFFA